MVLPTSYFLLPTSYFLLLTFIQVVQTKEDLKAEGAAWKEPLKKIRDDEETTDEEKKLIRGYALALEHAASSREVFKKGLISSTKSFEDVYDKAFAKLAKYQRTIDVGMSEYKYKLKEEMDAKFKDLDESVSVAPVLIESSPAKKQKKK